MNLHLVLSTEEMKSPGIGLRSDLVGIKLQMSVSIAQNGKIVSMLVTGSGTQQIMGHVSHCGLKMGSNQTYEYLQQSSAPNEIENAGRNVNEGSDTNILDVIIIMINGSAEF